MQFKYTGIPPHGATGSLPGWKGRKNEEGYKRWTDKADVLLPLSSLTVLDHNCSMVREAKGGSSNFLPGQQDF